MSRTLHDILDKIVRFLTHLYAGNIGFVVATIVNILLFGSRYDIFMAFYIQKDSEKKDARYNPDSSST